MRRARLAGRSDFEPPFEVDRAAARSPRRWCSTRRIRARIIPRAFLAASRLDPLTLRRSEDAFVDELFLPCVGARRAFAARALSARLSRPQPRAVRTRPAMFDGPAARLRQHPLAAGRRRASATIPRVVGDAQPIYRERDAGRRRRWRASPPCIVPITQRLAGLIERTRARFGLAILIDCHSMPSTLADVGRLRHRARRPFRRQRRALGRRGARNRAAARAAIASAATSPTPAATSPSITARPPPAATPCRSRSTAPFTWTRRAW